MVSPIVRIDYNNSSKVINLNDIGFLAYEVENDIATLTIGLTFKTIHSIFFVEDNVSSHENLETLYLDLYTKWKNKADEDREIETQLFGLE